MKKRANLEPFIENTIPVQQFADRIKSELAQSTTAWWTIAKIVGEADEVYGFSSAPMRELIKATDISKSKASKLVTVSKDRRLSDNHNRLRHVAAWTVLYELTTLADQDFETVLSAVEGSLITVAMVKKVRDKKPLKPNSQKTLVTIAVDKAALVSGQFTMEHYGDLINAIDEILQAYPNVNLQVDEFLVRQQRRDLVKIERELKRKIKLRVKELIAEYKLRRPEWVQYNNVKLRKSMNLRRPYIGAWGTLEELWDEVAVNPSNVFEELGSEYRREDYFNGS